MKRLTIDEIRTLLPDVEELRPFADRLLYASEPDEERRWADSGELGTVGERLVRADELDDLVPGVIEETARHLNAVYGAVIEAVRAVSEGDTPGAVAALVRAAGIERDAGRLREAGAFADAALRRSAELRDGRAALPALLAGARSARALGDWDTADVRYRQAAALARDAGDPVGAATALIGAGNVAVDRGAWETATRAYDEAEGHVRELPDGAPQAWHLEVNRSIVAREVGRLDDASAALGRAESLLGTAAGEDRAVLMNARGQLLRARGRDDEAELAFREALDAARSPDARVTIGVNLADVLARRERTLEAGQVARQAERTALRGSVVPRLPEVYRTLGRIAAIRGHADAFVLFERALEVVRERRLPDIERARTLEAYGTYDRERGELDIGRARLVEAARIYERLGCRTALDVVRTLLNGSGPESPPGGDDDAH